jgi:hypothetical protein
MIDVNYKMLARVIISAIILIFCMWLVVSSVSAYPYVYQGDNLTQGQIYDLSGVTTFGTHYGEFNYWKDWWLEGGSSDPTIINRMDRRDLYAVCIDSKRWVLGNWYKGGESGKNENNFAFKVVVGNSTNKTFCSTGEGVTPVPTSIVYDVTRVPTIDPLATTSTITAVPTTEPTPMETIYVPTTVIPTVKRIVTGVTPTFPPPRGLPLNPIIGIAGVIVAIVIIGRR